MGSKINYRPDIDGLRAVAVLAVVFYHAGIQMFSGGYVGVDVFFVISGYLIATIIVKEIEANDFSIVRFYERRIRRIYPALYAVTFFVLAAAAFLYPPDTFKAAGQSVTATTVFMSNILFWSEAGYFDAPSTLKPMLHTWSLAVEEQFYIVLPLLMMLIMRFARTWLKPILAILALTSFGFSVYYVRQDPSAAFYLTHLRAWELMTGSLLAINILPASPHPKLSDALSVGGMIMIATGVLLYTHDTPFPGERALLPVIGAALIIYSGMAGNSLIGNVLKTPPLVFIGKISYSLYLWHWVIIVFGKYYAIVPPTPADISAWLALSFVLAALSWKFVENPFRAMSYLPRPGIFIFAGSVMAVTLMAGAIAYFNNGLPQRFSPEQLATLSTSDAEWSKKWEHCSLEKSDSLCAVGESSAVPEFIIWGDSHATVIATTLDAPAKKADTQGYLAALSGCPPLLGVERENWDAPCLKHSNKVFKYIQEHSEVKTVILTARWAWIATGVTYKTEEGFKLSLMDKSLPPELRNKNAAVFKTGINRTVEKLLALNRKVIIVMPIPEVGYDVPSAYFIATLTGRDINGIIAPTYAEFTVRNQIVFDTVDSLKSAGEVQTLDPAQNLCDTKICRVVVNGDLLYRDNNHLSAFGSQYIASAFKPLFEKTSP